ncbi:hypothetical protein BGX27_002310 [Mortierella sp. AM989]|nr:hypothetical protein BGX27_002310 [Mortierella sp. AM989]
MAQLHQGTRVSEGAPSNTIVSLGNRSDVTPKTPLESIEKLRITLRPFMLYVVSMAQFLDIVLRCYHGSSTLTPSPLRVPTAMALIAINYPPGPERTKAFSVFAAFGGLGAVVGILMAGGLIASAERPRIDFMGSIASVLAVMGIIYYIIMGTEDGWASAKTLLVLFAGLICLGVFIYVESKVEQPIMPFRIWKITFILMTMMQGIIFYVNMIFQEVYSWPAMQTAVGFLVHSLLAIVAFSILGRTILRLSLKPLILTGIVLRCGTALLFAFVTENTSYWRLPFPALIIRVFGVGFSMLPVQITAVRDAANKDRDLVGAIYDT